MILLLTTLIAAAAVNISLVAFAADRLSPQDGAGTAARGLAIGGAVQAA